MKKILAGLVLCLWVGLAWGADWVAKARTTKGGDIVLLVSGCKNAPSDKWLRMYVTTTGGSVYWGCYMLTELHIMVVFDDGHSMAYDYSGWTLNNESQKPGVDGSRQRF